ncbi:OmpH family outer membrane protein [candidate division WOR-3 bacterium]|nr:OmpH family outer membrane protein [candidate division WOR-3 bacterium]
MGNRTIATILGVVITLCGIHASAVAVVDLEKVLEDFEDATIADRALNHAIILWKGEFDSLRNEYNKANKEFETQQPMLSEEALRARQQELDEMRRQYENFAQDIWGEGGKVEKKHKELFSPVMEKVNKVIEEIAGDEKYDIVLDASAGDVLYVNVEKDLTNSVIEELNREYASVKTALKTKVAVLSIAATDEKSQAEDLGTTVRRLVKETVQSFATDLNLEILSDADIEPVMRQYGPSLEDRLDNETAMNIASAIGAEYAYLGTVQKEGGEIVVTLTLTKPSSRYVYNPMEARIAEKDEAFLAERVTEMTAALQLHIATELEPGEETEEHEDETGSKSESPSE